MLTMVRNSKDENVIHNLAMFLHFMVNDVKIVEEQTMTYLINKLYKFTKQFNIIDSVKYVAVSWNDEKLNKKYQETVALKGRSNCHENPDLIIFTRRKDPEHRGFNAALLGGGNSHIKRKQQPKYD